MDVSLVLNFTILKIKDWILYIMSDEVILSVAKDFQNIFEGIGKSSLIEETTMELTPTARIPLA